MFRKKVTWFGLALFLGAIFIMPSAMANTAEKKEILIGVLTSLTGPEAMTTFEAKWACEQAANDINNKGGIFVKEVNMRLPVKLVFVDAKSTPDGAAQAMEKAIKFDKIDLALGADSTAMNLAAATVCEKYKVFFAMTTTWLDFVAKQNYQYASAMFTTIGEASHTPFLIWALLPKEERPQRPVLFMQDNIDGQGFGAGFKAFAEQYGYKFVVDEPYQPGTRDFSSYILKWKAANADALLTFVTATDGITLLRQMKEQKFRIPYTHGWGGFWPREFAQSMGEDSNYIIHDGFWNSKNGAPMSEELQNRYVKEHNGLDSVNIGLSYANLEILCMAIERAGSIESEKVRDAIFSGQFKSATVGDVKFDEKGLAFKPLNAMQWWNGERMPVYPPNTEVWSYKAAPAAW